MTGEGASPVTEADLHAYVDDLLAPAERARVEAHLAVHPDDAALVALWQQQAEDLRHHFAPELDEPVPPALVALLAQEWRSAARWRWAGRIAAALLIAALGAGIGWFGRGLLTPAPLVAALPQEAARAHLVYSREVLHPVEVPAAQEKHLVAWLSKRLGTELKVPVLAAQGYSLIGGRLLPAGEANAAQFMYENRQGQRLTLYVRSGEHASDTAFRFASEGKAAAFYWVDGGFGYALTGEVGREALLPVARSVYEQLTR
ncbi:MAG TPA: anti-sigma factor [Ferrovibrio sp.]|jgi:anti-sigma factor RsiW|uniref:anti-sigma factor family protein n=1 Tax=Ferrovibrio sp. TaxID=1917215 RepID=UPI002ED28B82